MQPPFHLAFHVDDLEASRAFYGGFLGCPEGRSSKSSVDFDFFGHQIVAHVPHTIGESTGQRSRDARNDVDGVAVPVPHFGAVLPWEEWEALAERVRAADLAFRIEPRIRFRGKVGEQGTFFLNDPSGNALEFKTFRDPERLFAK